MSASSRIRERWFTRGVDAFRRAAPSAPEAYACPLCARGFGRDALDDGTVTVEHAPPESLGGRPICLTCKDCNSTAGHTVDAHMWRRETSFDFAGGTMDEPQPARFQIGETTANVDYYFGPAGILVMGDPKRNHPETQARFQAELEDRVGTGHASGLSFTVTPLKIGHKVQLDMVGWLRSAYLVAFAALGYRYIFQRRLEIVRRQLQSPEETVIECFGAILPKAKRDERRFIFVEKPSHLRGLMLQMGRRVVFLPWIDDGLYEAIRDEKKSRDGKFDEQVRGDFLPWPKEPMHLIDFDRLPGITMTPYRPDGP
jgi:hypothetical protein